ncbi:hypothetical protein V2J09_005290 [Rumex salicifolius]
MEGIEMEGFEPVVEEGADFGVFILSKFGNSEDTDHQHLCVVLGAMGQELRDNSLALSPMAYFCSTVSSLDRLSSEPSVALNNRDHAVDSLVIILSMVMPRVSMGVLKKKKQSLLELLVRVLRSKYMSPAARTSGLTCIARLLMVRDDVTWANVAQMYVFLLNHVADSQSKVRRQSHLCLRDVLQSFHGTPLLGPASEGIKSMLERLILLAGGSHTAASEGPKGAQEVLYILDMLKECLPYLTTKYKSIILKFYKTLLELRQPLVSRRVTDSLNALCLHPTSEISPDTLLDLLCSLAVSVSTSETSADSMTFTARLLDAGMRKIYVMNRELCIAKLPVVFNALKVILEFDYAEAQLAAVEAMKSLIAVCLDDRLIEEGVLDIHKNIKPTIMGKVCATIASLLEYQCSDAWDMSFQVVSAMFDKLGVYSFELLGRTLKDLGDMQKLSDEDFPFRKQHHDCVGSALGAMGPEKFLSIIPLNFEAEDLSQANVWVIPILKQYTVGGSLKFYAEQLLDMAEHLKQRSSQLKNEGRVVSARNADALVYSLWSLLPSFCNYPLDTAKSFCEDLKTPLCSALAEEPDMRGIICSALQILIQQNKSILANNMIHDGENMPTRRAMSNYTQTVASENLAALKSSARDMLSVLPDVFMKSTKDCGGCLLATIADFASLSERKVVSNRFRAIMNGFLKAKEAEMRAQHLDIAMSLVPGLPEEAIDVLFQAINQVLKGYQGLVQKKGYKVLSIMLKNSDSFISRKLEELLKLMIEVMPSCHSSSKRHRLDCLYYLIVHISKNAPEEGKRDMISSFLTEIVLSLKEVNKKTRNRAFDILVQIGHACGDEDQGGTKENLLQFFGMVAGGLAGETPHMISACVKGLARLAYEFSDLISSTYNLLPSTFLLLQRKNREISKASLGLMKVLVAKSRADMLQTHLKSLVEGMLRWPNDTKNHFKAKVKNLLEMLVKKCGLDAVKAVMPEEHLKLLTNIRKINARKERHNAANTETGSFASKATTSRLSKWNHTKIFSDFDGESDEDDMDVETVSGRKSLASSRLKSKDSSLRSKRIARSGKTLPDDILDQLENEPLDLLDKQKTRSLLHSRGVKRKPEDNDEIEIDSEGRLIIREEADTKKRTTSDLDDDSDFDDDNKSKAAKSTVSSNKGQKRRKTSSESGYSYTGKEYTSKKGAKGDIKRKGKLEPYAYWPLDRKMVSKRPEHRASARRGMARVVKLSKDLEGQSSSNALSKLKKVNMKRSGKK